VAQYAIKFISGIYQGGEFPLPDKGEVEIGRTSDMGMVLVEEMVSRRHARIVVDGKRIGIIDLGSTNGTYVNGEKIGKVELKEGDRILIGTSILRLVPAADLSAHASQLSGEALRTAMEGLAKTHAGDTSMMGELDDVPFPDLVQLFASNKKTGALTITGEQSGGIYLNEGQILFAEVKGQKLPPKKAFARMAHWHKGHFQFKPVLDRKFSAAETITENTQSLLLESLRQFDEQKRIENRLPAATETVGVVKPMVGSLRALKPEQLDILQAFLSADTFQEALDSYPGFDFEAIQGYLELVKQGILETK
jgi:hypothetical protein